MNSSKSEARYKFSDLKEVISQTFSLFPKVWWRVAVVNLLLILSVLGLLALFSACFVLLAGGFTAVQNIAVNLGYEVKHCGSVGDLAGAAMEWS